jgi:RNA 2',3'-cyclic 3'-phosphodiesterase
MPIFVQHRLFLAFRPPAPALPEISGIRDAFRSRRIVPDDQLHLTLLPFPLYPRFPEAIARSVMLALSAAELTACRVIVDRLVLGLKSGLLQPSEPVLGLHAFQRMLVRLLLPPKLQMAAERWFRPHFTLFYDGPTGSSLSIEPISWTAEELVLVHSLHGEGRHETVARWPLRN